MYVFGLLTPDYQEKNDSDKWENIQTQHRNILSLTGIQTWDLLAVIHQSTMLANITTSQSKANTPF